MYLVKIKGVAKIPDYLQIRDDNFTLVCYTRTDRPEKALERCGLGLEIEKIKELMHKVPFGQVTPFEF